MKKDTILILEGMKYLHEKVKLVHTDLKPENILLVDKNYSKVDNFKNFPLNIKDKIYREYYSLKEDICKEKSSANEYKCKKYLFILNL